MKCSPWAWKAGKLLVKNMPTHLIIKLVLVILIKGKTMCEDVTYDINDKSGDFVMMSEFKATFSSTASMIPYQDITIRKVTDHNFTLWETQTLKESCTYILILKFEEMVMLIMKIKSSEGYSKLHSVKDDTWLHVSESDFNSVLRELRLRVPGENHILIDISNPNREKVTVKRRNTGGADFITFTTNYPYHLIKIVQGSEVIWRAPLNEDYCADCVIYLRNDEYELLQAFICTNEFVGFKFFTKLNNHWENIAKSEFYSKLEKLDLEHITNGGVPEDCNFHKCKLN